MKKIYALFALMLIFIFSSVLPANVYAGSFLSDKSETRYDVSSGLLTGKANTICQTDDGYIWIGQYAGLTKYDGKSFTTFTSLQGYNLTSIVTLASKGNILLIGSEKGLFVKDEKNVLTKIETTDVSLVVKDIKVNGNYAYIGTTSGLFRYDIANKAISRENTLNVTRIAIVNDDLYYYIVGKNEVYCNKLKNPVLEGNFKSICYDNNKIYIGTRIGKILVSDRQENYSLSAKYYEIEGLEGTINDILIKGDNIYVCADEGFYFGEKYAIESISMVKSYQEAYNSMEKAYFDYEGNLWLTSSALGVYKITSSKIVDYFFEYNIDNAITYAIEKFYGYTFIGTGKGLDIISDEGKKISSNLEGESLEEKALVLLINTIGSKAVRDIEIFKNKIYFATYGANGCLYYFDFEKIESEESVIDYLKYDDLSLNEYLDKSDAAKDFRSLRATEDYLFVGLDGGVSKYDGQSYSYIETGVYPLYMTINNDDLYLVLNTIGIGKISITEFENCEKLDDKNSYSALKCMYVDGGVLFSDNNILYYYKEGKVSEINLDIVGSVVDLFYANNKYYICSEAVVYIVDDIFKESPSVETLDSTQGLKSSLVANSSGYYDKENNKYYFATATGVLIYDLNEEADTSSKIRRKIGIDTVYIDGKLVTEMGDIHLNSNVENLTINFSVLSFRKEQNYDIYYQLKGFDKEEQKMSSKDSFQISYKNLQGGQYSFEIYTKDFDGTISANTITFNVVKDKKLSEYKAFRITLALVGIALIVSAVVLFYKGRIKRSIERQNEYKAITLESIEAIARTIDAKDTYTNGHSKRVGIYSREIAKALNLSKEEIDNIYYIALLHDIGKISVPLDILNKPGKLTDSEFDKMKKHTSSGGKILEGISTIPHIVEGAMYHHERYGGGGYPKGLVGDNIPFIARIICCADCYDAMATKRTYKEPYSKEKIIAEFERCSGSQFDPKIAEIVIKLIKEDKLRRGNEEKKEENGSMD